MSFPSGYHDADVFGETVRMMDEGLRHIRRLGEEQVARTERVENHLRIAKRRLSMYALNECPSQHENDITSQLYEVIALAEEGAKRYVDALVEQEDVDQLSSPENRSECYTCTASQTQALQEGCASALQKAQEIRANLEKVNQLIEAYMGLPDNGE
jgi:hypothetical protein